MSAATEIVHWPGQDSPMCDKHAEQAYRIARAMGFTLSSTLLFDDATPCMNCENEAKTK